MATTLTTTTFATTYKDDYKDSDQYYRILFNSGRALQARELTQMQTIIQSEIQRFGSNIFKEGGAVRAGNVTLDNKVEFVKVAESSKEYVQDNASTIVGLELTQSSPAVKIRVLEVLNSSGTFGSAGYLPCTLIVRYTSTSAATAGSAPIRIQPDATLTNIGIDDIKVEATADPVSGVGSRLSVDNGDYFIRGHFVFVEKQTITLDRYSNTVSEIVGFKIIEDVITADDNDALYDNQGAVPNIAAPGADRYRIRLVLTKKSNTVSTDNFVYLTKIQSGKIVDVSGTEDAYKTIADFMALRTKEESGDYVVKPFKIQIEDLNDSNLQINASAGIAYVDGYRLDIPQSEITLPKAQETLDDSSSLLLAKFGNYIIADGSDNKGLPNYGITTGATDSSTYELVDLNDDSQYGGTNIGTARIRSIEEHSGFNYKYYLFDVKMDTGQRFSDVRSIGKATNNFANLVLEDGIAVLKNTTDNSLLFPLLQPNPTFASVDVNSLTVQRRYRFSTGAADTTAQISVTDDGRVAGTFTDKGDWLLATDSGAFVAAPGDQITLSGADADFTGLTANTAYDVYAYVALTNPRETDLKLRTGSYVTKRWPDSADSDGNGLRYISLERSHVQKVTSIKTVDSTGDDLSLNFTFDNGQRDNFYDWGRIIPKSGTAIPNGDIYVQFNWFDRDVLRDFVSIKSYQNEVSYENVPSHRKNNGENVSLRDVLDFRSFKDSYGEYDNLKSVHALPKVTDTISYSATHYQPRKDRLVASVVNSKDGRIAKGSIQLVQGVSSFDPQFPDIPTNSIPLYDISLNAYTLGDSDLTTSFYDNRRFTMKDIARLEKRIDDLKELTTLSLLETNTSTFAVYDSAGNARTKAGFIADGFSNYAFSDIDRDEYRASIDPTDRVLTPTIYANNIRLRYDSAQTTANMRHGDLALLPIDSHVSVMNQNLATEALNVNPFAVITQQGHLDLSPASDTWVETQWAPDNIISGGTVTRRVGTRTTTRSLNAWRSSWFGRPSGDTVNVITGSRVIRELVGERVLDIQIIPFMRSIKVFFRAQGLRPNSQFFPFFGGTNISNYTRQEDSFYRFSITDGDVGNTYTNTTSHPSGSTNLISDDNGTINGSFIVPSNDSLKFRTGTQPVKLLDISVDNEANALSKTVSVFSSTGVLETRQRDIKSTRQLDLVRIRQEQQDNGGNDHDPLAQSFRIDQFEHPNGYFLTKVKIFFKTKSTTGVPVQVQIRTLENGLPTGVPIPGAVKFLSPSEVTVVASPASITDVRNGGTIFEFEEPVYLEPGQYAVVILAESTEYQVYVAETYGFLIGSTESRIDKQPTLGTLFMSQNSQTWTPDQTRDLMYELYRADFSTSGTIIMENGGVPNRLLENNPFQMDSGSTEVRVFNEGHGLQYGDTVRIIGLDSAVSYSGILGDSINGNQVVTKVDWTGYTFNTTLAATATLRSGSNGVIASQGAIFNSYVPAVQTLLPNDVSLSASVLTRTGKSYADNRNTSSASNPKTATYESITLNDLNVTTTPKVILASDSDGSSTKSFTLKLDLGTSDTKVSPVIDLQRLALTTFENIVDKQDSAATSGYNVPISFVNETDPTGGSSAAKHVTSVVVLEEQAVGLKILLGANRPSDADFNVYYKIGTTDEVLDDKNWILVNKETALAADNDGTIFRQYEYLVGGVGGTLAPFTQYQVKVVLNTTNSSYIPVIKDLRAIALVT